MLGNWDSFFVPYLFCRAFFVSTAPLFPGKAQEAGKRTEQLQHALNRVNERSRALSLGKGPGDGRAIAQPEGWTGFKTPEKAGNVPKNAKNEECASGFQCRKILYLNCVLCEQE